MGERNGDYCFMGTEFQFETRGEFWRQVVVWLYNNVSVLHATELKLKLTKMPNFMLSIFYYDLKNAIKTNLVIMEVA